MGSPTHYQNLPKTFRAVLDGLPGGVLTGKPVAAFDTSLKTWGPLMRLTAGNRLRSKLRKLGGKPVVKAETFLVGERDRELEGEQDLLYQGEIERAKEWAGDILNRLEW
jgi:flavodoxin